MTAARAPYSTGPRTRAARIVKAYVVTFMTPIATAMTRLPVSRWLRVRVFVTRRTLGESPGRPRRTRRLDLSQILCYRSVGISSLRRALREGTAAEAGR